ncbi:MAG TPA: aminotransferase class IV [Magnetospirillaceae bacterium]
MAEAIVFLNGSYVPESAAKISIFDRAMSAGDGIYDVARSFGHRANRLREHCERFVRSSIYTRIPLPYAATEMEAICLRVLNENLADVHRDDDRMIWMIATRGIDPPTRNPMDASMPTVMVYTLPIHYHRFAKFYRSGAHLITASTRRTPPECLDPRAKITNKMNHIQAEFEAKAVEREAFALMLATDGCVAEATASNLFFVRDGRVFTPRPRNILLGVMRQNVMDIAPAANIDVVEGDYLPYDLALADEMFITTTSFSILPIGRYNDRALDMAPGPVTARLMRAWSDTIGVDFVAQAESHASLATIG